MTWLLRFAMRRGWERGLLGGSQAWTILGGAALLVHLARRVLHRTPDVVFSSRIEPGESFEIIHESRPIN